MKDVFLKVDADLEYALTAVRDAVRTVTGPTRIRLDLDAVQGGVLRWDIDQSGDLFLDVERVMRQKPEGE